MSFSEHRYTSDDGLSLYFRDYGSKDSHDTILCLPGLTRNARDFHELALRLSDRYRVICADPRGRGMSDRDPDWRNYNIATYMPDLDRLMDEAGSATQLHLLDATQRRLQARIDLTRSRYARDVARLALANEVGAFKPDGR